MAQSLSSCLCLNALRQSVVCVFVFALAQLAAAQDIVDPTRPPLRAMQGGEGVIAPAEPVLQSILIGKDRKVAIIDGQVVKLNGKFGDQVLVKLTETEAVLKRGKTLQTLKLFPNFEKKMIPMDRKTNATKG